MRLIMHEIWQRIPNPLPILTGFEWEVFLSLSLSLSLPHPPLPPRSPFLRLEGRVR